MDYDRIEYELVLIGWVVALLVGIILLIIRVPNTANHPSYARAKNTCAVTMLLFGAEIFFQWFIRFYLELSNPILSVSVYLLTFWVVTLMLTNGFCMMLAPRLMNSRHHTVTKLTTAFYLVLLIVVFFLPGRKLQTYGVLVACALLFILACVCIYKSIVIYRRTIDGLRTYYSDVVENLMRWMPGVGFGLMLFLLSAPIICFSSRWVGIYQLALGIIMMIYTFVSIINFSFHYNKVALAITTPPSEQDDTVTDNVDIEEVMHTTLSESLREVMFEKAQRWIEHGGYRTPGITIEQVARDMGTNRNYLSRYLTEVCQVSFYEWVAQMRIEEAQSLMRTKPSLSIEQIASRVGFTSPSTFSSTFKKIVGIAPNKWRNQL